MTPRKDDHGPRSLSALETMLLARYAAGTLPRLLAPFVQRRLRTDARLAEAYDALRRVERAAHPGAVLSRAQKDHVKAMLFEGLPEDGLPAAAPAGRTASTETWRRLLPRVVLPVAAVAILLVIVVPRDDTWVSRGDDDGAPGLRVRCLDAAGTQILDEAEDGAGARVRGSRLTCPDDGLLAFSVTQRAPVAQHLALVLVDNDGAATVLYAPQDASAFAPSSVDVPLERALPMRGKRAFSIYALFSPSSVTEATLRAVIAGAEREGVDMRRLARFPLEGSMQARIDISSSTEAHAR